MEGEIENPSDIGLGYMVNWLEGAAASGLDCHCVEWDYDGFAVVMDKALFGKFVVACDLV